MVVEWRFSVLGFFLFISVYPLFWSSAAAMSAWNSYIWQTACVGSEFFCVDHTRTRIESLLYRREEKEIVSDVCSPNETTRFGIKTNVLFSQTSPSTANYVMAKNGSRREKNWDFACAMIARDGKFRLCGFKLIFQFIFSLCDLLRWCDIIKICYVLRDFSHLIVNFHNKIKAISPRKQKSYFFCHAPFAWELCTCIEC